MKPEKLEKIRKAQLRLNSAMHDLTMVFASSEPLPSYSEISLMEG